MDHYPIVFKICPLPRQTLDEAHLVSGAKCPFSRMARLKIDANFNQDRIKYGY